jgi:thiamine biosynthesis lipoprotein
MGTRFEIVLPADLPDWRAIGEWVLADIDEWHARLNRFAIDSWVSHVNRTAHHTPVACDEPTWHLLCAARDVWQQSAGAFDVTRGRGDALILEERRRTVALARPGVALDFGAIAKGHAIECAITRLRASGVTSAFVHGGTSSGAGLGLAPRGYPWKVIVGGGGPRLALHDEAFSVSDAASQGAPHIDGAAGQAVATGRAVVYGPSARLADAWSTAVVVLGRVPDTLPDGYFARIY